MKLSIIFVTYVDPLSWWHKHENYFPNIGFIAKQILGIPRPQIEIEHVLNLIGV
jgi:hypothetical protein